MNYIDIIVIAVVIGFAIFGMKTGFLLSAYRIASFFLSIFLAIKLYPIFSKLMQKTFIFTSIRNSIYGSVVKQAPEATGQVKQVAADTVISNMNMPGFLKPVVRNTVVDKIDPTKLIDTSKVMGTVSDALAKIVMDVLSLILLYILIRIALVFFKFVIKGLTKLPLLKQVNNLGGFILGAVEGVLALYIAFALITLFHTSGGMAGLFTSIDNSLIARTFYEHNFIVNWMFPKSS